MATIIHIDPKKLIQPTTNPNHMSQAEFAALENAVVLSRDLAGDIGILQPVLVRNVGGAYQIIDGAHRTAIAANKGVTAIPCVVIECTDAEASKLQIGLNKIRGALDVGEVAKIVAELDVTPGDLDAALTGYNPDGIADLLRLYTEAREVGEHDASPGDGVPPPDRDAGGRDTSRGDGVEEHYGDTAARAFTIELAFYTIEERDAAKRGLRKAAGGGRKADLSAGLLRLIRGR